MAGSKAAVPRPWTHEDDEVCTVIEVPHDTAASAEARHAMIADLDRLGVPDALIGAAELVLGELVANAVRHGRPRADGRVEVQWCVRREGVRVSVGDGGRVTTLEAKPFTLDASSGRGLGIVERLSEYWEVDRSDGVRITAALAVSSAVGA